MKYTHFDDICPNHRTDFVMLYFAACRSLRELQAAIRRTNGGNLTCRQGWLIDFCGNSVCQPKKLPNSSANNPVQQHTTLTLTFYANGSGLCLWG